MRASDRFEIEIVLAEIRDCLSHVRWKWEEAKQTVSCRIGHADGKRVRTLLDRLFLFSCKRNRKARSLPVAHAIIQLHGGLREGQRLWVSDASRTSGVFALWKPWSDGENATILLGVWSGKDSDDRVLLSSVRKIFRVQ